MFCALYNASSEGFLSKSFEEVRLLRLIWDNPAICLRHGEMDDRFRANDNTGLRCGIEKENLEKERTLVLVITQDYFKLSQSNYTNLTIGHGQRYLFISI